MKEKGFGHEKHLKTPKHLQERRTPLSLDATESGFFSKKTKTKPTKTEIDREYLRENVDSFKEKGFGHEQVLKTPKHLQEKGTSKSLAGNWKQKLRQAKVTKVSQTTFEMDTDTHFSDSTLDADTEKGFELTKLFFANLRGGTNGQLILIEGLDEDDAYAAAESYFNTPAVIIQEVSGEEAEQNTSIGSSEPDIVTPEAMRAKSASQDSFTDMKDDLGEANDPLNRNL